MEAINNKIVMDVQDAIDLYRYIAQLEAENKALKDGLAREREATQNYISKTGVLIQKYEEERLAWFELEKQMNIELQDQKVKTYKTSTIALIRWIMSGVSIKILAHCIYIFVSMY